MTKPSAELAEQLIEKCINLLQTEGFYWLSSQGDGHKIGAIYGQPPRANRHYQHLANTLRAPFIDGIRQGKKALGRIKNTLLDNYAYSDDLLTYVSVVMVNMLMQAMLLNEKPEIIELPWRRKSEFSYYFLPVFDEARLDALRQQLQVDSLPAENYVAVYDALNAKVLKALNEDLNIPKIIAQGVISYKVNQLHTKRCTITEPDYRAAIYPYSEERRIVASSRIHRQRPARVVQAPEVFTQLSKNWRNYLQQRQQFILNGDDVRLAKLRVAYVNTQIDNYQLLQRLIPYDTMQTQVNAQMTRFIDDNFDDCDSLLGEIAADSADKISQRKHSAKLLLSVDISAAYRFHKALENCREVVFESNDIGEQPAKLMMLYMREIVGNKSQAGLDALKDRFKFEPGFRPAIAKENLREEYSRVIEVCRAVESFPGHFIHHFAENFAVSPANAAQQAPRVVVPAPADETEAADLAAALEASRDSAPSPSSEAIAAALTQSLQSHLLEQEMRREANALQRAEEEAALRQALVASRQSAAAAPQPRRRAAPAPLAQPFNIDDDGELAQAIAASLRAGASSPASEPVRPADEYFVEQLLPDAGDVEHDSELAAALEQSRRLSAAAAPPARRHAAPIPPAQPTLNGDDDAMLAQALAASQQSAPAIVDEDAMLAQAIEESLREGGSDQASASPRREASAAPEDRRAHERAARLALFDRASRGSGPYTAEDEADWQGSHPASRY